MILLPYARSVLLSHRWLLCFSTCLLLGGLHTFSQAQITLDGSLGPRGALQGPHYAIPDTLGHTRGPNLFHSFGQFNLVQGESATFTGPTTIQNVIGRVTGGSTSVIDGLLRSQIPGAHLFLLNPSGIVFGPNARLDVQGSLHVSTADYLRLADGARFSARLSDQSTFSVAPPAAFGFLGPTPAPLTVNGSTLTVPQGKTISLVGGAITLAGTLAETAVGLPENTPATLGAPEGRIHLVSLASAGEVTSPLTGQPLDLEGGTFARMGQLELSRGARVTTSNAGGQNTGEIEVRAGTLRSTGGSQFDVGTQGEGRGGRVTVVASNVLLDNGRILARTTGRGDAGEIAVRADTLTLTGGAEISSSTRGGGHGGRVSVVASNVYIDNGQLSATASSQGDAGEIKVEAGMVMLIGRNTPTETFTGSNAPAQISGNTQGEGRGGRVTVVASDFRMEDGRITTRTMTSNGSGDGGEIVLRANTVTLTGSTNIGSGTRNEGRGGRVTVEAGTLYLEDTARISSTPTSRGDGGEIVLRANTVTLTGNAEIDVRTQGTGRAGRVSVKAGDVRLEGQARIEATADSSGGAGGEIAVRAGTLTLTGKSQFSVDTQGMGPGGRVSVEARDVRLENGFIFAGTTGRGDGGEIAVRTGTLTLTGKSQFSVDTSGEGRGGRVSVEAHDARLDDGFILARTMKRGAGGEITVRAGTLTLIGEAEINSSTQGAGGAGSVTVQAREALMMMGSGQSPARIASDNTSGSGDAGQVVVSAPLVHLDNGRIQAIVNERGSGRGGEVTVRGDTIKLTNGARISSSTFGANEGGTVTVTAQETIVVAGAGSEIAGRSDPDRRSDGGGGRVDVSAPTVRLEAGGSIVTVANAVSGANSGNIKVQAGSLTLIGGGNINSSTEGAGRAGNVTVQASEVTITGGAQIRSSSGRVNSRGLVVASRGDGGNVTISATEALIIAGQNPTGIVPSGVVSETLGMGTAGQVTIDTPRLTLAEGGRIGTDTGGDGRAGDVVVQVGRVALTSGAQISSRSGIERGGTLRVGTGAGGTVTLTATEGVTLAGQGSGLAASTAGQGRGGEITVQAPRVELTEGATISAASTGPGNAGNVSLTLGDTFVSTNGSIVTRATQADGGNIQITAPTMVRLRDSAITAEVGGGATTVGGNITIDPQFVLLQNSQIVAKAVEGQGGNIRIQAQQAFLADPASQVSASSALGINGQVAIQAPVTSISGAVAPLPQEFASIAELLRDRCAGRLREGRVSRLVLGGRDGVPSEPGSLLPSPLLQTAPRKNGEQAGAPARTGQVQERSWHVQAGALEGLDAECVRWIGPKGSTVGNSTYLR